MWMLVTKKQFSKTQIIKKPYAIGERKKYNSASVRLNIKCECGRFLMKKKKIYHDTNNLKKRPNLRKPLRKKNEYFSSIRNNLLNSFLYFNAIQSASVSIMK